MIDFSFMQRKQKKEKKRKKKNSPCLPIPNVQHHMHPHAPIRTTKFDSTPSHINYTLSLPRSTFSSHSPSLPPSAVRRTCSVRDQKKAGRGVEDRNAHQTPAQQDDFLFYSKDRGK